MARNHARLDPQAKPTHPAAERAKAATPEARDSLFDMLDESSSMFKRMLAKNPHMCRYKSWGEIPAELKYNYDEEVSVTRAAPHARRERMRAPLPRARGGGLGHTFHTACSS